MALVKQAAKLFEEGVRPKAKYSVIAELASQGFSAKRCCRVLGVAASGFFMWRRRAPSPRQLCFAWLTELVRAIHADSRGTYGWRRVNAELVFGHGVVVNRKTVRKIMRAQTNTKLTGRWTRGPRCGTDPPACMGEVAHLRGCGRDQGR